MASAEANDWKSRLVDWSFRQGPSFVLLLLIGYSIYRGASYVVEKGVPAHLEQIQKGYKSLEESHEKAESALLDRIKDNSDAVRKVAESVDRLADKVFNQKEPK